jgi:hypothetical protein
MAESANAARASLPATWFGRPEVPLIDGRGKIWRRFESDAESLWDYTFGHQILAPYDFTTAMTVAIREFAPDRIVLLGPGETLAARSGRCCRAELAGHRQQGCVFIAPRRGCDPDRHGETRPAEYVV